MLLRLRGWYELYLGLDRGNVIGLLCPDAQKPELRLRLLATGVGSCVVQACAGGASE